MKYTLSDTAYQALRSQVLRDSLRFYGPLFIAVMLYGLAVNNWDIVASGQALLNAAVIGVIGFAIALATSLYATKSIWEGYQVSVGADSISQKSNKAAETTIHRGDIIHISEVPQSGLRIRAHKSRKTIYVPHTIEQYNDIKHILGQWHPIQQRSSHILRSFIMLFGTCIVLVGSQYILVTAQHIAVVILTGTIILSFILGGGIILARRKTLRWYMALLMFILFCYNSLLLIGRLYRLLNP